MSYTPTPAATRAPVPHPVVLYKHRDTISFTHLPRASSSASASAFPTPTGLGLGLGQNQNKGNDIPFGAILVILSLLFILARINKRKQRTDTEYTGIQMNQLYTLDPVRRRRV
jgi:hypothetical protein